MASPYLPQKSEPDCWPCFAPDRWHHADGCQWNQRSIIEQFDRCDYKLDVVGDTNRCGPSAFIPLSQSRSLPGIWRNAGRAPAPAVSIEPDSLPAHGVVCASDRTVLITGLLFMALSPLTEDWARSWLIRTQRWGKAALVSGSEPTAASIAHTLKQNLHLGLLPVRSPKDLPAGEKLDTAILAPGTALSPTYDVLPHLYVLEDGGILHPLQQPTPWLARLAGNIVPANPRQSPWRLMKRMIDLAVGSIALLLALPLIVLAAAFIYARDPGPVFYSQMRRGLAGKPIRIWKLRSMYKDSQQRLEKLLAEDPDAAAEWHSRYKLRRDPRILPGIGAFIRTFSIDELPQLFAVLRGELSLVGPRVFVDYDLDIYNGDALRLRQSVMPGLTGLWQVAVRSTGDNSDKPLYDIAYVRNWSIWSDIDILYRTIDVVITGRGAT